MANEILRVQEIIKRIPDCATEPFLCRCDDGELYVVKGMPCVTKKQLIAEWVSACLASELKLSLPDFRIVYVDQSLTEYVPAWKNELSEGYAFATRFIAGVSPITFTQAHKNVDEKSQKQIYLFDKWINNSDRTLSPQGGNVNIIFDYLNNRYYLIDHNLAFDHDEDADEFEYHVYSERHRQWLFDFVDKMEGEDEARKAKECLARVFESIPQEWMLEDVVENKKFLDFVESTLDRINDEVFWSNIK
ncbi:hypothetical protein CLM65_14175 [Serratia marcescens]|uniref:HipA family kinase n=1 Tax=Serratia marcescens TaxID=615 RepID=UPI00044C1F9A|nr:HipA family kinase [Serratia marcescens]AWC76421.1 hypothetical protein AM371_16470 [Serratia marcescens]EZQ73132.1 hypothetical protein AF53_00379 [Serratia marcescens BIDMC 80]RLO30371.1 hypothetical protein CLM65_14175 [Serratia marcescens]HBC0614341.1 hypothetical protein [Serratia marcescens]